jgi:MFS family permease
MMPHAVSSRGVRSRLCPGCPFPKSSSETVLVRRVVAAPMGRDLPTMSAETSAPGPSGPRPAADAPGAVRHLLLGLLAVGMLMPVTMPVPVLRGFVTERFGVSEFATSWFMSINNVGSIVAAPLVGALVDRFGRRRAWLVTALALDALLLQALAWPLPFSAFLVLRFCEGCAGIAALSVLLSVGSDLAAQAGRPSRMGFLGGGITLGVAIGAPVGGILGRNDVYLPLHVGSALLLATGIAAAFVVRGGDGAARSDSRPSGLGAIVRAVRRTPALVVPLAYAFADRFTVGFFTTTFQLFLTRIHGFERARIGILLALFLLPFALLSYPAGRLSERVPRVLLVAGGSFAYGLAVTAVGYTPADLLPALMLGLGLLSAVMFVPSLILVNDLAPLEARGTALGAFNAAGSLGFVLGPVVGGAVSQGVAEALAPDPDAWLEGYRLAFVVAGASEILCVVLTLRWMLAIARRPSPSVG